MCRPVILVVLAMAIAMPVLGQHVILYENDNFRGRSVTLRQPAANLAYHGFENRVSSLNVMSGTWEVCTEPFFRGRCRTFSPGKYASLGGLSNSISSARAVEAPRKGQAGAPGAQWTDTGAAEVSVYDRRDFQGPLRALREATPNFEPLGINDAVASIVVRRGTWEFCTDAHYRGECRTYGPGRYPSLPAGQDDRYSSARPVAEGARDDRREAREQGSAAARIHLFEHGQFAGRSIWLNASTPNFERIGFNDRAESVIVEGGAWTLCSDANGQGKCFLFRPGRYPVLPPDLNSRISSAYPQ